MIAHNIVLTLCFLLLGFACLGVALLALAGGPEGGSDSKLAVKFVACAGAAAVGIVGLWMAGEWAWLFWFFLLAIGLAMLLIYEEAMKPID